MPRESQGIRALAIVLRYRQPTPLIRRIGAEGPNLTISRPRLGFGRVRSAPEPGAGARRSGASVGDVDGQRSGRRAGRLSHAAFQSSRPKTRAGRWPNSSAEGGERSRGLRTSTAAHRTGTSQTYRNVSAGREEEKEKSSQQLFPHHRCRHHRCQCTGMNHGHAAVASTNREWNRRGAGPTLPGRKRRSFPPCPKQAALHSVTRPSA